MKPDSEFQHLRQAAEGTLSRVLAHSVGDGSMEAMNLEADRARGLAQLDCWAPRWLQAAFAEVDRLSRWADLRADLLARVDRCHSPRWFPDGTWRCTEDRQIYPCNTKRAMTRNESND